MKESLHIYNNKYTLMPVLTLSLIPKAPIKIPETALSNNKWQNDKYKFYLNEKSKDRVDQGIYPLIRNTQEMFKAEFTRIDNQSNKDLKVAFTRWLYRPTGRNLTLWPSWMSQQLLAISWRCLQRIWTKTKMHISQPSPNGMDCLKNGWISLSQSTKKNLFSKYSSPISDYRYG